MAEDLKTAVAKSNGYDPNKVKAYTQRVENIQGEIDEIMAKAKEECAPLRDDMKGVKKQACDEIGVTPKVFNTMISERRLRAKADRKRDELDTDQQDSYDTLLHALGDFANTGLGGAALSQAAQ